MYEIVKEINESTAFAFENNRFFVLKRIEPYETEFYKKLKTIKHPNLAEVVGFTVSDGKMYVVLNYISGVTLREYAEKNGALSDEETRHFATDVCRGLCVLHGNSIVHRDINPNNIIITDEKRAVIIDFGICRFEKENQNRDTQILGTHGYAAPEQYGFNQTSEKSDIYSVGVLLNFMKTLALPNEKRCDGKFAKIIAKCTEIDERNRYKSVEALLGDIAPKKLFEKFEWVKTLKTAIYSIFYAFSTLLILGCLFGQDGKKFDPVSGVAMFFLTFVPFWIVTDFLHWSKRFGLSSLDKGKRIGIKIGLFLLSWIVSILLIPSA